jgi:mannose-6-phosphate isomerase-like protein (cupin superfamily)
MQYKNIMAAAIANTNFRQVLFTNQHSQVVLMSILPGEDIGTEIHHVDQILVFAQGSGKAILNGEEHSLNAGDLFVVPAGVEHNFINTGTEHVKLFTIYAPAEHKDGTVHATKAEAEADEADHTS